MSMTNFATKSSGNFPAFDVLHRECCEAIEFVSRSDDAGFPAAMEYMLKHLAHAFRIEEYWMEDRNYPALLSHREQHARVLAALHHVQAAVLDGDMPIGRHAIGDLLPKWLALHVDTMDTALSLALRFNERRRAAPRRQPETAVV